MNEINEISSKSVVLYHANCADGFGAAFAAWKYFGDAATYIPVDYNQETLQETLNIQKFAGKHLYILDFSFPKDVMYKLDKICSSVTWLDHHKSAFELYGLTPNKPGAPAITEANFFVALTTIIELDTNRSGAMIAWNWFHLHKPVPSLISHIDDYDRWMFQLNGTKEFNKALWARTPWSFEFFNECLDGDLIDEMISEGAALLKAHDSNVSAVLAASKMECNIAPVNTSQGTILHGLAANCPAHLSSDVGHKLATESGTFGLAWYLQSNGNVKCSLRSNGDYDVSVVAKNFKGGGHKNAAGFVCSLEQLLQLLPLSKRNV